MSDDLSRPLAVAIQAVAEAGLVARTAQETLVASRERVLKADRSPVTVADLAAQAVMTFRLLEAFPGDPIMAEEDASTLSAPGGAAIRDRVLELARGAVPGLDAPGLEELLSRGDHPGGTTGRFWVMDPVDGTKGFLRGEQFAIALALVVDGDVELGVVGCPNLPSIPGDPRSSRGCLVAARRGSGAFQLDAGGHGKRAIGVDGVAVPAEGSFCESVERAHSSHGATARVAALLGITAPPYRVDGQTKYAIVARGEASLYLRLPSRPGYREKIWDHAAGSLVVSEAGGRVTHVDGSPLDFSSGRTLPNPTGIVVSNGHIHSRVLAAVREVLAGD